jgi:hypothetical protein
MVQLLGRALLAGSLVMMLSVPASAQRKAAPSGTMAHQHEFGVDLEAAYVKPSGGSGGLAIGLPVDIRLGLLTHKKLMFEPRLSLAFNSAGTTTYAISPGLNVLYQRTRGSGPNNLLRAPYLTGGVALTFFDLGAPSGTQLALNAGVGKRVPYGGAAARFEGFFRYAFSGGDAVSSFAIGARIGLSFWH